jgi:hypothetical protein
MAAVRFDQACVMQGMTKTPPIVSIQERTLQLTTKYFTP